MNIQFEWKYSTFFSLSIHFKEIFLKKIKHCWEKGFTDSKDNTLSEGAIIMKKLS